jgi:C-methyltransferase
VGLSALKQKMVPPGIALLDFIGDYWSFNVVFALAELRVVDALSEGARGAEDLARELSVDADHLYRLLRAASVLGIVKEESGRAFSLKPLGHALCDGGESASFRDFILFMGRYGARFWSRLPDCIRTGKSGIELETGKKPFEYLLGEPEVRECFNRAMTGVSNLVSQAIAAAYDFSDFVRIVDVGGGHGRMLSELLKAGPKPRGVLYDLPEVVADARPVLSSLGATERIEVVGGSFFDSVPEGGDCYTAKAIIHDWKDEEARTILRNVRRAIRPEGKLLLCECVVPPAGQSHFSKLLDLEMIVHAGGRERTVEEYRALYESAGFYLTRIIPTGGPTSIIEGRPV